MEFRDKALLIGLAGLVLFSILGAIMYETVLTEKAYVVCIEAGHEPHECAR